MTRLMEGDGNWESFLDKLLPPSPPLLSEVNGEGVVDVQGDELWGPVNGKPIGDMRNTHRKDRPPR